MAKWLTACVIVEFLDGSSSNLSTGNSFSLYWILDWIGLDWIWIWFNSITYTFQWGQFGLDWIVQSKIVKIKGRIYPWVLTNARRINPINYSSWQVQVQFWNFGPKATLQPILMISQIFAVLQAHHQPHKIKLSFQFLQTFPLVFEYNW